VGHLIIFMYNKMATNPIISHSVIFLQLLLWHVVKDVHIDVLCH
jgi:hypothetical protein